MFNELIREHHRNYFKKYNSCMEGIKQHIATASIFGKCSVRYQIASPLEKCDIENYAKYLMNNELKNFIIEYKYMSGNYDYYEITWEY